MINEWAQNYQMNGIGEDIAVSLTPALTQIVNNSVEGFWSAHKQEILKASAMTLGGIAIIVTILNITSTSLTIKSVLRKQK